MFPSGREVFQTSNSLARHVGEAAPTGQVGKTLTVLWLAVGALAVCVFCRSPVQLLLAPAAPANPHPAEVGPSVGVNGFLRHDCAVS